jgi:hypothetical protein
MRQVKEVMKIKKMNDKGFPMIPKGALNVKRIYFDVSKVKKESKIKIKLKIPQEEGGRLCTHF